MKKEQLPKRWTAEEIVLQYGVIEYKNEEYDLKCQYCNNKLFISAEEYDKKVLNLNKWNKQLRDALGTQKRNNKELKKELSVMKTSFSAHSTELNELKANSIRKEEVMEALTFLRHEYTFHKTDNGSLCEHHPDKCTVCRFLKELSLSEPKARIEEGKYCFCKKPKEVKKG